MRMVACGQEMEHLPHWMQTSGSHDGISRAMLRFSHCAVPVGKVPSTGKALTGRLSPWPAMMRAVKFCTNSGASCGHGRRSFNRAAGLRRDFYLEEIGKRLLDSLVVFLDDFLAFGAIRFLDGMFNGVNRFIPGQDAGDCEKAGLHDGVDPCAHPGHFRDLVSVDDDRIGSSCQ